MFNSLITNPLSFIILLILLLVTISVHEYAHARTADYLGDPTARLAGRLTLNPISHIDLFGLLFLFFFGFGWGKPVPFDPFNLQNPKKDSALISLAGPLSNLIIAFACSLILRLFIFFKLSLFVTLGEIFFGPLISLNVMLGLFNLIPIAPLDGFKIIGGLVPEEKAADWYQLEKYGMIFLLLFIFPFSGKSMLDITVSPLIKLITSFLIP